MEREEKVKEGDRKMGEFMGGKLKIGILVGKREGNTTPSPTWKFGLIQPDGSLIQDFNVPTNSSSLSARKLGANLWEVLPQLHIKMSKNGPHLSHGKEEKAEAPLEEGPSQKISGSNLRKQVTASQMQHSERLKSVGHAQQPMSPASHSSSMEVAPQRPDSSPSSSLVSRGKFGESTYGLKTSTELLKVLNRIWSLEEKHALDMSLVKTLRNELDQAQARIKELLKEKKRDQKAINNLIKQINEEKLARKNNEQDRIKDAVKSMREELEDERKLRRRAEKLYHKLADENTEFKSSLSNALEELEQEKKGRRLLEDLCDEFAKGVIDYEQEVRFVKQKSHEDRIGKDGKDRLVLHIAEAWLDERMQMKLEDTRDTGKMPSVLDKLSFEIETFLREKQFKNSMKDDFLSPEKHSLESLHLNDPGSAPWNGNDEDDSISADNPSSHRQKGINSKQGNCLRRQKGRTISAGSLKETKKVKLKKKILQSGKAVEGSGLSQPVNEESTKTSTENADVLETNKQRRLRKNEVFRRSSSAKLHYEKDYIEGYFDPSTFAGPPSPVKKWTSEVRTADPDITESSSGWPQNLKPNTLKAKLLEARLESQQARARATRGISQVD